MAVKTTVFTPLGDQVIPVGPNSVDAPLGQTTPAAASVTTLSASGATNLAGGMATSGTVVLNGATPVTVAAAALTAKSQILFTLKTVGGSVGANPVTPTVTPGTGFTVAGTAGDTSTYNWALIG